MLAERLEDRGARTLRVRRFLLSELPPALTVADEHIQLTDNYVEGTRLRLRKRRVPRTRERTWHLQQLRPVEPQREQAGALVRLSEIELSEYEYEVFSVFEGNELRINRYPYEHDGRAYEVDIYLGVLWGLLVANVRFESDEELRSFVAPPFAAREITGEEMFEGAHLAGLSADKIREELARRASA